MITVIIPALNEEKTIRQAIQQAKRNELVDEIIVVDDFSSDNTIAEAKKEDVKVISSTHIGKGDSMREGMMMAKNEILVFMDADIPNYEMDVVEKLYGGYGEHSGGGMRAGHQDAMFAEGNMYLDREFPKLDKLLSARVE